MTRTLCLIVILLACKSFAGAEDSLKLSPDLKATLIAGDAIVPNCYTITTDSQNHGPIFASGPGYIRALFDDDKDGVMDRFVQYSDFPKSGAQGLLVDGKHVYSVGDKGVLRFADANGDHVADAAPELMLSVRVGGEHHAHALRKGPDGFWYLMGGNHADEQHQLNNDVAAPVKHPRAGVIWRISPDWQTRSVWCHGFRNAYDFDFLADGSIVVYDSDGERDVTLPWYRPTRVFQASAGSDAGWVSRSWKQPNFYFDSPRVLAELGRGSPTGVVAAFNSQLPQRLRRGAIVLDWTFGRVVHVTDQSRKPETIAESTGTAAFAVTDACIDRDGSLLVSVGGRGTTGGIYRIETEPSENESPSNGVKSERGTAPVVSQSTIAPTSALAKLQQSAVPVATLYSHLTALGTHLHASTKEASQIKDLPNDWHLTLVDLLSHEDREVRRIAAWVAARLTKDQTAEVLSRASTLGKLSLLLGQFERNPALQMTEGDLIPDAEKIKASLNEALAALKDHDNAAPTILQALRLVNVALGDLGSSEKRDTRSSIDRAAVFDGYRSRLVPKFAEAQRSEFEHALIHFVSHTDDRIVDEAIRTLAVLQSEATLAVEAVAKKLAERTQSLSSSPERALHCLIAMGRLRGQRSDETSALVAAAMLRIPEMIASQSLNLERNFPARMKELWNALTYHDLLLEPTLVSHEAFGTEQHLLWAEHFRPESRKMARGKYLKQFRNQQWPRAVARFVAGSYTPLPRTVIRKWLADTNTRDAGYIALAQHPRSSDLKTLLAGLDSFDSAVRSEAIEAVAVIAKSSEDKDALLDADDVKRIWRESQRNAKSSSSRTATSILRICFRDENSREALTQRFGELSGTEAASESIAQVQQRLARIDWSAGDIDLGKQAFERIKCSLCHGGKRALGPNLAGVSKRFGRDDLLKAIYDPSRDIPDRYQARIVVTVDGQAILGMVIYESKDGLTLLDQSGTTRRINADNIDEQRPAKTSLMPTGLLKWLSNEEIAGMIRYIETL